MEISNLKNWLEIKNACENFADPAVAVIIERNKQTIQADKNQKRRQKLREHPGWVHARLSVKPVNRDPESRVENRERKSFGGQILRLECAENIRHEEVILDDCRKNKRESFDSLFANYASCFKNRLFHQSLDIQFPAADGFASHGRNFFR